MRLPVFKCQRKATSKRSGVRCKNCRCRGRETCRMHGGTSRRGAAHPNFGHGRRFKVLGEVRECMAQLYEQPVAVTVLLFPRPQEELSAEAFKRFRREGVGLRGLAVPRKLWTLAQEMRALRAARRILAQELAGLRAEADDGP